MRQVEEAVTVTKGVVLYIEGAGRPLREVAKIFKAHENIRNNQRFSVASFP